MLCYKECEQHENNNIHIFMHLQTTCDNKERRHIYDTICIYKRDKIRNNNSKYNNNNIVLITINMDAHTYRYSSMVAAATLSGIGCRFTLLSCIRLCMCKMCVCIHVCCGFVRGHAYVCKAYVRAMSTRRRDDEREHSYYLQMLRGCVHM